MVDLPAELGCFVPSPAAGHPPIPTRGHCLCLHVARSPVGRRWGWGLRREVGRTHRAWGHGPRGGGLRQRWGDHGDKPRGCRGAERSGQEELPGRAVHRLSRGETCTAGAGPRNGASRIGVQPSKREVLQKGHWEGRTWVGLGQAADRRWPSRGGWARAGAQTRLAGGELWSWGGGLVRALCPGAEDSGSGAFERRLGGRPGTEEPPPHLCRAGL